MNKMNEIQDEHVGIEVLPDHNNITINNGTITGFFNIGIKSTSGTNFTFKDLIVTTYGNGLQF